MKRFFLLFFIVMVSSCDFRKTSTQLHTDKPDSIQNNIIVIKDSLVYENNTLAIFQIDSVAFFSAKRGSRNKVDILPYISDFEVAEKLLWGRVVFGDYNSETQLIDSTLKGEMIYALHFDNGESIFTNEAQYFWDTGFIAYYPTEGILLCEGGHSSDFSIDLKNGIVGADLVGNPSYIILSPTGKYRLNGWFPGQECSNYFLQNKIAQDYQLLARIPMHISKKGFDFCTLKDEFWQDDTNLYFRNTYLGFDDDPKLGYFRLQIKYD